MTHATIQSVGSIVTLEAIPVMGKATVGVKNSEKTFNDVESNLDTMRGRKFYGLLYGEPDKGEYFACIKLEPRDDPRSRRKIRSWYPDVSCIGKGFGLLFDAYPHDSNRPTIEFYRSERDVYIFLPIKET
ncbi:hypothetical protein HY339_03265 [Candidatus Gottesmanbacteria bacterium]|nr:hypothetical protein [Candidatus Gottesmanbacteria bacterium]